VIYSLLALDIVRLWMSHLRDSDKSVLIIVLGKRWREKKGACGTVLEICLPIFSSSDANVNLGTKRSASLLGPSVVSNGIGQDSGSTGSRKWFCFRYT